MPKTRHTAYEETKQHLLHAALLLSPSEKEQRSFNTLVTELEKDHEDEKTILRILVSTLYDGLAYGNWPRT